MSRVGSLDSVIPKGNYRGTSMDSVIVNSVTPHRQHPRPPPSRRKRSTEKTLRQHFHEQRHKEKSPDEVPPVGEYQLEKVIERTRPLPVRSNKQSKENLLSEEAFRNIQKTRQLEQQQSETIAFLRDQPLSDDDVRQGIEDKELIDAQLVIQDATSTLMQLKRVRNPDKTLQFHINKLTLIKDKLYDSSYTINDKEKQEVEDAKTYLSELPRPGTGFMKRPTRKRKHKKRKSKRP